MLHESPDNLIAVPFLIRGRLVAPPALDRATVAAAFASGDGDYRRVAGAQLLREPLIDRATLRYTGAARYLVMPDLNPYELIEPDPDALLRELYALPSAAIFSYMEEVAAVLQREAALVARVRELIGAASELPDALLDLTFAGIQGGLDRGVAEAMIDSELSLWQIPGRRFLDGWVAVPGAPLPEIAPLLSMALPSAATAGPPVTAGTWVRAMPTRQLHITAGNAPTVPVISALRLLLTKSAGTIKLPSGAILSGALFARAAHLAAPDHPITRHLSVVYWPGGDERVEGVLFQPNAYDRVVIWGAPGAVSAVQARALFTRTISFNPRYGVSLIGREAQGAALRQTALRAATDTLIYNQKACNAAMVHYVEGSADDAARYAAELRAVLAEWDDLAPQVLPPATIGQLRRMRRGRYVGADWLLNERDGAFSSGVVVMPDEFDILDHPLCRLVVVRHVAQLDAVLPFLSPAVSTAGVAPEPRRLALRDRIAARGVSSVLPLGQCERAYPGMPHDGMVVLSQLVEWKNS